MKCTESTRKLHNDLTHFQSGDTFNKLCDELEKEFDGQGEEGEKTTPYGLLAVEFVKKHWTVENGISKCEW